MKPISCVGLPFPSLTYSRIPCNPVFPHGRVPAFLLGGLGDELRPSRPGGDPGPGGTAPAPGDELRRLGRGGLRGSRRGLSRISAPLRAARFSSRNNVPAVPAIFASRARARGLGDRSAKADGIGGAGAASAGRGGTAGGIDRLGQVGRGIGALVRLPRAVAGALGDRGRRDCSGRVAKGTISGAWPSPDGTAAGFGGFLRLCGLLRF